MNIIYKEMEYCREMQLGAILAEGDYKNIKYYIISYGTHPCCYLGIPENHHLYAVNYEYINFNCHGGLTYSGFLSHSNPNVDTPYWYIGWDYAHCLDKIGLCPSGEKWTTNKLINEIRGTIDENLGVLL